MTRSKTKAGGHRGTRSVLKTAPDCGSGGCGFNPRRSPQTASKTRSTLTAAERRQALRLASKWFAGAVTYAQAQAELRGAA